MNSAWSVGKIFQKWAMATPEKPALIIDNQAISYRQLNQKANKLANALQDAGLKKGDRIAGLSANTVESICLYVAAAKLGLVCVPLNNRLFSPEILYQVRDSSCRAMMFDQQFGDRVSPIAIETGIPRARMLAVQDKEILRNEGQADWCVSYDAAVKKFHETEPQPDETVFLDDPLAIIYTSGTTGAPKGVVVSHQQTYFKCFQVILYTDMRQDDRFLTQLPLFHSAGLFIALTPALCRGATLVTNRGFNAGQFVESCEQSGATILCATTTMWKLILREYDRSRNSFKSVRCVFGGGEKTQQSLVEELASIGLNLQLGFGQTENSFMALQSKEDSSEYFDSVGRAGFFTDVWIQDADGNVLPHGEIGSIVARGPTVMSGYWNLPEKTSEAIVEGVLHTGDLGYLNADGQLYLVDREKDMYRSGAENVYPAEIEKCLINHPKILDVAVIGVPDPDWGETGKAFVVLKPGEQQFDKEEMYAFLDGKLARYKYPKHIQIMDGLPTTETGKVRKVELKKKE